MACTHNRRPRVKICRGDRANFMEDRAILSRTCQNPALSEQSFRGQQERPIFTFLSRASSCHPGHIRSLHKAKTLSD